MYLIGFQEESSESDGEAEPENLSLPKNYSGRESPGVTTTAASFFPPQLHPPPSARSPVDVLLRVFPQRRRSDVEAALHRAKGDVLQAIEMMVSSLLIYSENEFHRTS